MEVIIYKNFERNDQLIIFYDDDFLDDIVSDPIHFLTLLIYGLKAGELVRVLRIC